MKNNEVLTPHTNEPIMQQNLWFKETQNLSPLKANNLSMKDPIALKEVKRLPGAHPTQRRLGTCVTNTKANVSVLLDHHSFLGGTGAGGQMLLLITFFSKSEKC